MRLSIIIPVYNASKYLEQCIRSIYQQDLPMDDFEVITVDNASSDASLDILRDLRKEFGNLRVMPLSDNHYAGGGRNAGMSVAQGNYILFVDADDYLYPHSLRRLLEMAERETLDMLDFDYDLFRAGKIELKPETTDTQIMPGSDLLFSCGTPWDKHVVVWRNLYKRDFLVGNKLSFPEDVTHEDVIFALKAFAMAKSAKHSGDKVYVYRCHDESTMHRTFGLSFIKGLLTQAVDLSELKRQVDPAALNESFFPAINQLLRYDLAESYRCYRSLKGDERREARMLLRNALRKNGNARFFSTRKWMLIWLGIV